MLGAPRMELTRAGLDSGHGAGTLGDIYLCIAADGYL